jgi:hypothetical protein
VSIRNGNRLSVGAGQREPNLRTGALTVKYLAEWLPKLCYSVPLAGPNYSWARKPTPVTIEGSSWTIATNGWTIVAIAGQLPEYLDGTIESAIARRSVSEFLRPFTLWHEIVPLTLLRGWCGPAAYAASCACVGGCERCDHVGFIEPEPRPGRFLGGILDRRLLACALEGLESEMTRVVWAGSDLRSRPLMIEPAKSLSTGQAPWRVVIMPMTPPEGDVRDLELIATSELDPSWLSWNGGTVLRIARSIKEKKAFDCLPILADALEDAGCNNRNILEHCRRAGRIHPRGCWVIELLTEPQS